MLHANSIANTTHNSREAISNTTAIEERFSSGFIQAFKKFRSFCTSPLWGRACWPIVPTRSGGGVLVLVELPGLEDLDEPAFVVIHCDHFVDNALPHEPNFKKVAAEDVDHAKLGRLINGIAGDAFFADG
jgi:hypothetical protein